MPRRIRVEKDDVLVVNGIYELSAADLRRMINPNARMLWAFITKDARVMPVMYTEDHVIWLTDKDMERTDVQV